MAGTLTDKYKGLLGRLFPPGKAWENVRRHSFLAGVAVEFGRVETRGQDLLREIFPQTTTELLPDWEELTGLPDETTPTGLTTEERRNQVIQKLASLGGHSGAYYEYLAEKLGFDVEYFDPKPLRSNEGRCGEYLYGTLPPYDYFYCGQGRCGERLGYWDCRFVFIIYVDTADLGDELLEKTIRKYKPAETGVVFLEA